VGNGDITLSTGTIAPTLSTTTVSQTEGSSTEVTITNYDAALTYVVESLDEAVATVSRVDGVLTITGSDVSADGTTTVRVNATASGMATSEWVEIDVDVIYVPIVADTAVTFNFATDTENNGGFE
jgi:hypothetical protein